MELILYSVNDGDNVMGKTLINGLTLAINLKKDTDIVNPSLLLASVVGVDFTDYNYCHIPMLKRFYMINDIENINSRLWRLNCECDVLETYKADILMSKARFKRGIKSGDFYDGLIDTSVKSSIQSYDSNVTFVDESSYILTTMGTN